MVTTSPDVPVLGLHVSVWCLGNSVSPTSPLKELVLLKTQRQRFEAAALGSSFDYTKKKKKKNSQKVLLTPEVPKHQTLKVVQQLP